MISNESRVKILHYFLRMLYIVVDTSEFTTAQTHTHTHTHTHTEREREKQTHIYPFPEFK
jgi:hypothetical protein